jgi:hypothetical protein
VRRRRESRSRIRAARSGAQYQQTFSISLDTRKIANVERR